MLMPKRVKHRKTMRGRMKGKAQRGNFLAYGEFGIIATQPGWITSNQIEAARQAMTRSTKRGGQVWIKIFPDKPVTAKPVLGRGCEARPCALRNRRHRRSRGPRGAASGFPQAADQDQDHQARRKQDGW